MSYYEKSQKIEFGLGNIDSIRDALKKYQILLQNDMVFDDEAYDVEFVYVENGEIKPLQIEHGDEKIFHEIEGYADASYTHSQIELDEGASEGIFFSHAIKYGELLDDIVETVKEIVNYSRRYNDTSEMWMDDMTVFGLDPIFILSKKHPEYTYLLGAYMIPYWDTEHANYVLGYLSDAFNERGFDEYVMKAFCYCDNWEGRDAIINRSWESSSEDSFDLDKYFRENPEKYQQFKFMLKERFNNQRFLQYSDSDYTDKPIHEFYKTIYCTSLDNEEDFFDDIDLDAMFIEDTYENEAYKLHEEIVEYLGEALVDPYKDPYEDDDLDEEDNVWEEFFLNGFDDGEEIWNYILYGEDDLILDSILPIDIRRIGKEKKLSIYNHINYHINKTDSVRESFHEIFEDFIYRYYEEDNSGFIVKINGSDVSGREIVIRALDVFYLLFDKHMFSYDLYKQVISYGIMRESEFIERYDSNTKDLLAGITYLIVDALYISYGFIGGELNRIFQVINKNREKTLTLLEGGLLSEAESIEELKANLSESSVKSHRQLYLFDNGLKSESSSLRFIIYLLSRDFDNRFIDNLTRFMMDFVEKNWLSVYLDILKEESELTDEDMELISKYIIGRPTPPMGLIMKAMQEGKESLTDEEKQLLSSKEEEISADEVIELLKDKLNQNLIEMDPQIQYEIFDRFEDEYMNTFASILYLGSMRINMPSSQSMKKALQLLIKLAPIRVIKSASYILDDNNSNPAKNINQWYDFESDMKKLCKDDSLLLAWEILGDDESRYEALVQAYVDNEIGSKSSFIKTISREDIEKALSLIDYSSKTRFYDAVCEIDENIVISGEMNDFFDYLPLYISKHQYTNDISSDKLSEDLIEYIKGDRDFDSIKYIVPLLGNLSLITRFSRGLWNIKDEMRDRVIVFLKEYGIEGLDLAYYPEGVEIDDYVSLLLKLQVSHEIINAFLIDLDDEEGYCSFIKKIKSYDFISKMDVSDRLDALELVEEDCECIDFVKCMIDDTSLNVKNRANSILNYFEII